MTQLTTKEFLQDLARRLNGVPPIYPNAGDAARLEEIAEIVPSTEQDVVLDLVRELIAQGYAVTVDDGDEGFFIQNSVIYDDITAHLFSMDEDHLFVRHPGPGEKSKSVRLIYGNAPDEVIADYSTSLETLINNVQRRIKS